MKLINEQMRLCNYVIYLTLDKNLPNKFSPI